MTFKNRCPHACIALLFCLGMSAGRAFAFSDIGFITVDELKASLDRNDSVLIIDVRTTDDLIGADTKIASAIHIRSRRLQARLAVPPLKDILRDKDIVIYCACPKEETSIRAARTLLAAGFIRVRVLKGGWRAWLAASGQVDQTTKLK
ncbi:MAG TPA: rhodanese-like domain-containing protein [Terriglobia bacterium]|nr:rhodanese-like domain-containing protein [Terriglobia bacterium]